MAEMEVDEKEDKQKKAGNEKRPVSGADSIEDREKQDAGVRRFAMFVR